MVIVIAASTWGFPIFFLYQLSPSISPRASHNKLTGLLSTSTISKPSIVLQPFYKSPDAFTRIFPVLRLGQPPAHHASQAHAQSKGRIHVGAISSLHLRLPFSAQLHVCSAILRLTCHGRYDLPPHQIAKPLPVVAPGLARKANEKKGKKGGNKGKSGKRYGEPDTTAATATPNITSDRALKSQGQKRKRGAADFTDDAPRAFKRMMALKAGKAPKDGLDDGQRAKPPKKKNAKAAAEDANDAEPAVKKKPELTKEMPTIRPGERMSEFAARVDAALPVMGLVAKGTKGKDPLGLKIVRTRKERKMHKLYDEWRREEEAIQDKRKEEAEEAEEKELEDDSMGVKWRVDMEAGRKKKGKKGKKGKSVYETDDGVDDPWAELKKKRGEAKIGLHDVAKAPPVFKSVPQEVFKVRGAGVNIGTIPKAAGSLKRREELQEVREEVVAQYRRMMEGRRAKAEQETETATEE